MRAIAVGCFVVALGVMGVGPTGPVVVAAQDIEDLAARCAEAGHPALACTELAVTARAIQGQVGFLTGLGSEVSGSAGTLGRRLGATPRISVGVRGGFMSVGLPDAADPNGLPSGAPSREATFTVPVVHAGLAVGVFDGFSLAPTVGGFLSLDLLAQTSTVFLPVGQGFDGRVTGFSLGARLGMIRESFTLPGIALSATRRGVGKIRYGAGPSSGPAVEVDPTVTSVRATVGKDLLGVGLLAGAGWDRYSGGAALFPPGMVTAGASVGSFRHSRSLVFGGAALNFLVLQLSAEAGWVRGFSSVQGYEGRPFDPTRGSFYGSLAARLTI